MEVDNDKSLEEMGFVPSVVSDLQAVQRRGLHFLKGIAAVLVEDDGKPALDLCRNCNDCRLAERSETLCSAEGYDQTNSLSKQVVGRFRIRWIPPKNVGIPCWPNTLLKLFPPARKIEFESCK